MVKSIKKTKKSIIHKDISNNTIVLMLLLVVVISIITLGIYVHALNNAAPDINIQKEGPIPITIVSAPAQPQEQKDQGSGTVGITILKPQEKKTTN